MKKLILMSGSLPMIVLSMALFNGLDAVDGHKRQPPRDSSQIEYGRYLVHNVAMCIDCHSPRGADGRLIEDRQLTGSTLGFAATVPMPWAPAAPGLAGLPPHYTPEDMVQFLMSGKRPAGLPPALPPMPTVRMNKKDATAVTAYLMSLKTGS